MRLVPCPPPAEPLQTAPSTVLMRDVDAAGEWAGFWSGESDAYYARRTTAAGLVDWYTMADGGSEAAPVEIVADSAMSAVRVLPFRSSESGKRPALIVAEMPGGRPMLVGSSRRSLRP